ncbi:WD40 repeat domain-containing protein [Streptomyces africanus]
MAASGGQLSSNLRNALTGHTGLVEALACTEVNGRPTAVTGSEDRTVRMWDLITGDPVGSPMAGHTGAIEAVACTYLDGRPVAVTVSRDESVRLWDLGTCRAIGAPMSGHSNRIRAVACLELDGRQVAVTGGWDHTLRVWDLGTGQAVGKPVTGTGLVNTLACVVLKGRPVVVTGSTDSLALWDLTTRRRLRRLDRGAGSVWYKAVTCTELNGRPVAISADRQGRVRVWDFRKRRILSEFQGHEGWASSVSCAVMDGKQVAVAGYQDGTAQIWDLEDRRPVGALLCGHAFPVLAVAYAELEGQPVVITSAYDTLRIWDLSRRAFGSPVVGHTQRVLAVDHAVVDGRPVVVTGSEDTTMRIWQLSAEFRSTEPLNHHTSEVNPLTCKMLNGRPIAIFGTTYGAQVWDLAMGRAMHPPFADQADELGAFTACVELNGREVVVTGTMQGSVRVWDLATGALTERFAVGNLGMRTDACVIDGRLVAASVSLDKPLRVLDVTTGRSLGQSPHSHPFRAITVGRLNDRPIAVTCSESSTVHIWELPGCHPVGEPMTGHTRSVWTVTLAELDGRSVALTGSADNTVRIWDLEHRTTLDVIHLPGPCSAVSLSDDGLLACAFGNDVGVFSRE